MDSLATRQIHRMVAFREYGIQRPQLLYKWTVPDNQPKDSMFGDSGDIWIPCIRHGIYQGFHENSSWAIGEDRDKVGGLGPYALDRLGKLSAWRHGRRPMYIASISTVTAFVFYSCLNAVHGIRARITRWVLKVLKIEGTK
jgi:hypothetical protein